MIIGLTGTIASGKSTVANHIKGWDWHHFDADIEAKKITKNNFPEIIKLFNLSPLTTAEEYKKFLLSDKKNLKNLEDYLYPKLSIQLLIVINNCKNQYILLDAAKLIEANWAQYCDYIIVTKVIEAKQLERLNKRNNYDKKQIEMILANQLSQAEKLKYADFIIDTNYSIEYSLNQLANIKQQIENNARNCT